jgi:hypothetical protein
VSEVVTRQVQGELSGEMQKQNDWSEFHVTMPGKQYPVKLSTKLDDVKTQAREAFGKGVAVWTFDESDGNENPNRPGTFYKNRRLKKVEVGGTLDPELAGQTQSAPAPGKHPSPDGREASIERQVILKALLPQVAIWDWSWEQTMEKIRELDAWFGESRPGGGKEEGAVPPPPQAAAADDDDIPF